MSAGVFLQHAVLIVAAMVINCVSQIGMVIMTGGRLSVVKSLLLGYAVGLIGLTALSLLVNSPSDKEGEFWALTVADVVLFTVASYCWFHYVNIGEASVRIRILREIAEAGCDLSREEVLSRYNAQTILESRLERLVQSGQLKECESRYFLGKPRLIHVARIFDFLKLIVLGKRPVR